MMAELYLASHQGTSRCFGFSHIIHLYDLALTVSPVFHLQVTLLFNDTGVFPPVVLASEVRQHRLTSLTPGRLYKIVVSTFSGPYQRAQFIEGRTGETKKLSTT